MTMSSQNKITDQSNRNVLGQASHVVFFTILGLFWCVGLVGVLGGLKIFPGVNPGLYGDFDFQSGLIGLLYRFYDPLYKYCLPIFAVGLIGSLAMAICFRANALMRIAAYGVAFVPVLFPILYLILWVMLVFELSV